MVGIMLVLIVGVLVPAAVAEHAVAGSQEVVADFSAIGVVASPLAMSALGDGKTRGSGRISIGASTLPASIKFLAR